MICVLGNALHKTGDKDYYSYRSEFINLAEKAELL